MLFPVSFEDQTFRYGPQSIAYAAVLGAGIGVTRTKRRVRRALLVAHQPPNEAKPRLLVIQDVDGGVASELQRRMPDRWQGEAGRFAMRSQLGFSNTRTFVIVALLVVIACAISAFLITMAGHG